MARRRAKVELRTIQECRDYGHSWVTYDGGHEGRYHRFRVLICHRCETERRQLLNLKGAVLKYNYKYQPGYQLEGGPMTAEERGQLRLYDLDQFEKNRGESQ